MGTLVTRADLGFLAIFEAVMLPLAAFGPGGGWKGLAGLMAGTVVACLASRFLIGVRRDETAASAPMLLSLPVGLGVAVAAGLAFRWAGLHGDGALGATLGLMLTAFVIVDRWWANRGRPSATPARPA
jgi:hypothetical protein